MTTIVPRGDIPKGMPVSAKDHRPGFLHRQVLHRLHAVTGPQRPELEY